MCVWCRSMAPRMPSHTSASGGRHQRLIVCTSSNFQTGRTCDVGVMDGDEVAKSLVSRRSRSSTYTQHHSNVEASVIRARKQVNDVDEWNGCCLMLCTCLSLAAADDAAGAAYERHHLRLVCRRVPNCTSIFLTVSTKQLHCYIWGISFVAIANNVRVSFRKLLTANVIIIDYFSSNCFVHKSIPISLFADAIVMLF